ncbi:uncharacterized [Tachysurus ichikawai]
MDTPQRPRHGTECPLLAHNAEPDTADRQASLFWADNDLDTSFHWKKGAKWAAVPIKDHRYGYWPHRRSNEPNKTP